MANGKYHARYGWHYCPFVRHMFLNKSKMDRIPGVLFSFFFGSTRLFIGRPFKRRAGIVGWAAGYRLPPLLSFFFSQHQQDRLGWGLPGDDADLAEDEVRWGSIHAAGQCYASVQFPALKFRISQDKQPISFPCAVEVEVVLFCYLSSRIFVVY